MIFRRGWDVQLMHFGEIVDGEPFVWGETDCWHIAYKATDVVCKGKNPLDGIFPFRDLPEAVRLRTDGLMDASRLEEGGYVEVKPKCVRSGDLVITEGENHFLNVGIVCEQNMVLTSDESRGVFRIHISKFGDYRCFTQHETNTDQIV